MTTNAFLFAWDCNGIESIIPITQYELLDKQNLIRVLGEEEKIPNPLGGILNRLILRARFNSQRHYEIYSVDCDASMDEEFWKEQWETMPQETADLLRERGQKIYSDRVQKDSIKIT